MEQDDLADYKEVQTDYEDFRFGQINIFHNETTNSLVMQKKKLSQSPSEHTLTKQITQDRLSIQHPNILSMKHTSFNDEKLTCDVYFTYPNEDLYERKAHLKNPREILKLLSDCISGLARLEKENMVHGNLKPEFIYYEENSTNYVILDRLADKCSPNQAQLINLQNNDLLYMSPKVFENIIQENLRIKHNPFKSEIFSLGMVILSVLVDDEDLMQSVYNFETRKFDKIIFSNIVSKVRKEYFSEGDAVLLGDFFFICVVNPDSNKRMNPRKANICLKRTAKTFENELTITKDQNIHMSVATGLEKSELTQSEARFGETADGGDFFNLNVNPSNIIESIAIEEDKKEADKTNHQQTGAFPEGEEITISHTFGNKERDVKGGNKDQLGLQDQLQNYGISDSQLHESNMLSTLGFSQGISSQVTGQSQQNDAFLMANAKDNLTKPKSRKNVNSFTIEDEEEQQSNNQRNSEIKQQENPNRPKGTNLSSVDFDVSVTNNLRNNKASHSQIENQTVDMTYSIPTIVNQPSQKHVQSQIYDQQNIEKQNPTTLSNINVLQLQSNQKKVNSSKGIEFQFEDEEVNIKNQDDFHRPTDLQALTTKQDLNDAKSIEFEDSGNFQQQTRGAQNMQVKQEKEGGKFNKNSNRNVQEAFEIEMSDHQSRHSNASNNRSSIISKQRNSKLGQQEQKISDFNSKEFLENNQVEIIENKQSNTRNEKSKNSEEPNSNVHNQNIQIINNNITNINIIPLQNSNLHSNLIDETKNIHENIDDIKKQWEKQNGDKSKNKQDSIKNEKEQLKRKATDFTEKEQEQETTERNIDDSERYDTISNPFRSKKENQVKPSTKNKLGLQVSPNRMMRKMSKKEMTNRMVQNKQNRSFTLDAKSNPNSQNGSFCLQQEHEQEDSNNMNSVSYRDQNLLNMDDMSQTNTVMTGNTQSILGSVITNLKGLNVENMNQQYADNKNLYCEQDLHSFDQFEKLGPIQNNVKLNVDDLTYDNESQMYVELSEKNILVETTTQNQEDSNRDIIEQFNKEKKKFSVNQVFVEKEHKLKRQMSNVRRKEEIEQIKKQEIDKVKKQSELMRQKEVERVEAEQQQKIIEKQLALQKIEEEKRRIAEEEEQRVLRAKFKAQEQRRIEQEKEQDQLRYIAEQQRKEREQKQLDEERKQREILKQKQEEERQIRDERDRQSLLVEERRVQKEHDRKKEQELEKQLEEEKRKEVEVQLQRLEEEKQKIEEQREKQLILDEKERLRLEEERQKEVAKQLQLLEEEKQKVLEEQKIQRAKEIELQKMKQQKLLEEQQRLEELHRQEELLQQREERELLVKEEKLRVMEDQRKKEERDQVMQDILKRKEIERQRTLEDEIKQKQRLFDEQKALEIKNQDRLRLLEEERQRIQRSRQELEIQRSMREQKLQSEQKEFQKLQKIEEERIKREKAILRFQNKETNLKKILKQQRLLQSKSQKEFDVANAEMKKKLYQQNKQYEQIIKRIEAEQEKQKELKKLFDQQKEAREKNQLENLNRINLQIELEQQKADELEAMREDLVQDIQKESDRLALEIQQMIEHQDIEEQKRREQLADNEKLDEEDKNLMNSLTKQEVEIMRIQRKNEELLKRGNGEIPDFDIDEQKRDTMLLRRSRQVIENTSIHQNLKQSHKELTQLQKEATLKNLLSKQQFKYYKVKDVFQYSQSCNNLDKDISVCKIYNFNHTFRNKKRITEKNIKYEYQMCHNFYIIQFLLKFQHLEVLKRGTMKSMQVTNLNTTYQEHKQRQEVNRQNIRTEQNHFFKKQNRVIMSNNTSRTQQSFLPVNNQRRVSGVNAYKSQRVPYQKQQHLNVKKHRNSKYSQNTIATSQGKLVSRYYIDQQGNRVQLYGNQTAVRRNSQQQLNFAKTFHTQVKVQKPQPSFLNTVFTQTPHKVQNVQRGYKTPKTSYENRRGYSKSPMQYRRNLMSDSNQFNKRQVTPNLRSTTHSSSNLANALLSQVPVFKNRPVVRSRSPLPLQKKSPIRSHYQTSKSPAPIQRTSSYTMMKQPYKSHQNNQYVKQQIHQKWQNSYLNTQNIHQKISFNQQRVQVNTTVQNKFKEQNRRRVESTTQKYEHVEKVNQSWLESLEKELEIFDRTMEKCKYCQQGRESQHSSHDGHGQKKEGNFALYNEKKLKSGSQRFINSVYSQKFSQQGSQSQLQDPLMFKKKTLDGKQEELSQQQLGNTEKSL